MRRFLENNVFKRRYLLVSVSLAVVLCFQTMVSATDPPQLVVSQFYRWYVQNEDQLQGPNGRIAEQQTAFTSVLYQLLVQRFQRRPGERGLDFGVFCDCQTRTFGMTVRSVRQVASGVAEVNIDVYAGLRGPGTPVPMQVIVVREGDRWQIQNIFYRPSNQDSRNLLSTLRSVNY